jgi:hypothetical protein
MSKPEKKKFFHSPIIQDLTYVRLILNLYERKIGVSRKANVLLYGHGEYFDNMALETTRYKKRLELQHTLITKALGILKLDDPGWSEYATIDNVELMGPMILAEKNSYGKYDLPAQFRGLFDVVLDGWCFKKLDKNLMDARNKDESVIILDGHILIHRQKKKTTAPLYKVIPSANEYGDYALSLKKFTDNYTHNTIQIEDYDPDDFEKGHTLLHIKKKI